MSDQCLFLSQDELNALLAQGYMVIAGPFPDVTNCLLNCGSSSSSESSSSSSSVSSPSSPSSSSPSSVSVSSSSVSSSSVSSSSASSPSVSSPSSSSASSGAASSGVGSSGVGSSGAASSGVGSSVAGSAGSSAAGSAGSSAAGSAGSSAAGSAGSSGAASSGAASSGAASSGASSFPTTLGCSQCPAGAPLTWQVTFSGVTNSLFCTTCANWNGTWLLTYQGGCTWSVSIGTICLTPVTLTLQFFGGTWSLQANLDSMIYLPHTTFDCLGSNLMDKNFFDGNCTNYPAQVTVSPA